MVWLAAASSSVAPSGALFATEALPMMSCTPPAAKGTMIRTVWLLQANGISSAASRLARFQKESFMAKAYWITCYRSIKNPDALAAYAKLAGPSIQAAGGKFLVRGSPAKTYEAG